MNGLTENGKRILDAVAEADLFNPELLRKAADDAARGYTEPAYWTLHKLAVYFETHQGVIELHDPGPVEELQAELDRKEKQIKHLLARLEAAQAEKELTG
jgi:hypothetical protein